MKTSRAFALLLIGGCGYHIGSLNEYPEISIPIFENKTERRLHEFDLTQAVIREASRRGIRVTPGATVELRGEIATIDQSVVVPDPKDQVRVGSLGITVTIAVVNIGSHRELLRDRVTESASFDESRGKTLENARTEVFDRLSKIIVSKLERNW